MGHHLEITEAYRTYTPPEWFRPTVERILGGIPPKYLAGVRTLVLTDAGGMNHNRRRAKTLSRRKKVRIVETLGLYHRQWKGEPAWIELFADNIVPYCPSTWWQFTRDITVGRTLAHEVGHHIHATQAPEYREREDVAEKWEGRLLFPFLMRRYWYFFPLVVAVIRCIQWVKRLLRRKLKKPHKFPT